MQPLLAPGGISLSLFLRPPPPPPTTPEHPPPLSLQVANYCVTKLAELNVPLCTHAVGLTPDSQLPPANGQQYLELTCNGYVSSRLLFQL